MGLTQSRPPVTQELIEKTGFTAEQIEHLHKRFIYLTGDKPVLRNLQPGSYGYESEINFEQFLIVMSYFRPMGGPMDEENINVCRRDKLRFLFNMYDTDNDSKITLDEYRNVVEELLSGNLHIEKETARSIADGAMMEAASICVGQMEPDQIYEGITFEDFLKIWEGIDIETKMHVRFLNMDTIPSCH
ncbi:hypothetical protein GDO81_002411 [Engystomops pustulosus]|uniref:Calcineurin B homologous protein 3 n=1 Tax=Engystomops pustulosus TaxID=76066 RepID=A0AAV7DKJ0_ENGPU|nr:hypothetical protein GDO81_002411 [Engystomops pustulosus]